MTTYIKGTFPVRFRRDGKDGVNVWVKYATVLDLKDSNTGKSYPSNKYIFNSKIRGIVYCRRKCNKIIIIYFCKNYFFNLI